MDEDEWLPPEDLTDEELGHDRVDDPVQVARSYRQLREGAQAWRHLPDEPPPAEPAVTPTGIGSVVRAVRWRTGCSQRELATTSGVPASSVIRLEAEGESDVRLSTLVRLLDAAGLRLAVVDGDGTHLTVPYGQDRFHDQRDRKLPAHREIFDPRSGRFWWGYGLLQQPYPHRAAPPRVFRGRRLAPRASTT